MVFYLEFLVKWTKTLQSSKQSKIIHLPFLGNDICPITAIKTLLKSYTFQPNSPLFQLKINSTWKPLTDVRVRKHLKKVLLALDLQNSNITFHTFRRSGATFAFNHNVNIQNIKKHGTWTSDCVWQYITDSAETGRQVASMFQRELS